MNTTPLASDNRSDLRKICLIFLVLSLLAFPLYIYHNPVRWEAFYYNSYAFLFALRPYTWYGHLRELLLLTWLALVGGGLGIGVLRRFRVRAEGEMPYCEAMCIGWGILAFILFALALLQTFNAGAIALVLGILTLPAAYFVFQAQAPLDISYKTMLGNREDWSWDVYVALFLIFLSTGFSFFSSLMPPTQSDGLRYHLTVPNLYLRHGGFYLIPDVAFSNFPFLIEYLYAIPLAFGLHSGPKLIHFCYFLITLSMVNRMGRQLGGLRVGIYSVLLLSTTPFVPIFASWSFIEMGLTAYTVLGFRYALAAAQCGRQSAPEQAASFAWLAGIAGGLTLSCKYTALATVGGLALLTLDPLELVRRRSYWMNGKRALSVFIVAGFIASPWFLKNWLLLGNPVYPFADGLFPTPNWSEFNGLFFSYHAGLKGSLNAVRQYALGSQIMDFLSLPFRLTFFPGDTLQPEDFGTWPIGSVWLILGLTLFFRRHWTKRALAHIAFTFFLFVLWAYSYRDTRFLLPAMAIGAPVAALAAAEIVAYRQVFFSLLIALILYSVCHTSSLLLIPPTYAPWWVVSGAISEKDYLEKVSDFTRYECQAFSFLRENAGPEDIVLLHGIEQTFYCPNPYIGADWFNTDVLIAWSWENPTSETLLAKMKQNKVKYLIYNYGRIEQYRFYYRFFRLPPEFGFTLFQEYVSKEATRLMYPLVYENWMEGFMQKLRNAEESQPSIQALEGLLNRGMLKEVFRYDESPTNLMEGIVVYEVNGGE